MAKPVHSMIRVFDEAKSLDFYARAFGLEVADHLKFPDFALIYLRHPSSPFEVELTVNFDRKEPYALGHCATSSMTAGRWRASSSSPIPMVTRSK
jgi:lactoylglutathione lyase